MKTILSLFVAILFACPFLFPQQKQMKEDSYPQFIPYKAEHYSSKKTNFIDNIKNLGNEQPARWLSVDPMANKYPSWSPYNYSLNDPLRYFDPNGKWSAERDKNGNIIAKYEKGDTYKNLYTQLGISAEKFSKQYGVDLSNGITSKSFNITSFVVANNNYDANPNGSNCFGFVAFAGLNEGSSEQPLRQLNVSNLTTTQSPHTGDVAVFYMKGQYQYKGQSAPIDANNIQGHSAIFVLNNHAGEAQYLNRINTGQGVTINTQNQIIQFFSNPDNATGGSSAYIILPKLNPNPTYYNK